MRCSTHAAITCWLHASRGAVFGSEGLLLNYSRDGCYIETSRKFDWGSILCIRLVKYPPTLRFLDDGTGLRSIFLAEVKWRRSLSPDASLRYGLGLKYL